MGMQSFEWNSSYSVGDVTLDEQHKKLLLLCKRIAACVQNHAGRSDSEFRLVLNELIDYARNHFEKEEQILRSVKYPFLEEQEKEHSEYEDHIVRFLYSALAGMNDKSSLNEFLGKWWVNHILVSDMKYAQYLKR